MTQDKKSGNITIKELKEILKSSRNLNIDKDTPIEYNRKLSSIAGLSEFLNSISRLLMINATNDLMKKWTGKDRDNLDELSLKDIELIIKKAIESKQYNIAAGFSRTYKASYILISSFIST